MRAARIKEADGGFYHVISRIVDRRMILNDREKERFRKLMHSAAVFSGVQVLTYAVLDNHFHILLHVPAAAPLSDEQFVSRLGALYRPNRVAKLAEQLAELRSRGQAAEAERLKGPYLARMHDLSGYMKTLKQRFSQSYNRRHGRKGTLWEERFKSILIEGEQGALSAVAAYIDLNAVRAGIVGEAGLYRYCGYAEALGGSRQARAGLSRIMCSLGTDGGWQVAHAGYRKLLYMTGDTARQGTEEGVEGCGFSAPQVEQVLKDGGRLTLQQALYCRVRYFSDGLILGSRGYVDEVFSRFRDRFGAKRTSGARPIRELATGEMFTARRLQVNAVTTPAN